MGRLSTDFENPFFDDADRHSKYRQWSERAIIVGFNGSSQSYDIIVTTERSVGNNKRTLNRTIRQVKSLIPPDVRRFSPGDSVLIGYETESRERPIILGAGSNVTQRPAIVTLGPTLSLEGERDLGFGGSTGVGEQKVVRFDNFNRSGLTNGAGLTTWQEPRDPDFFTAPNDRRTAIWSLNVPDDPGPFGGLINISIPPLNPSSSPRTLPNTLTMTGAELGFGDSSPEFLKWVEGDFPEDTIFSKNQFSELTFERSAFVSGATPTPEQIGATGVFVRDNSASPTSNIRGYYAFLRTTKSVVVFDPGAITTDLEQAITLMKFNQDSESASAGYSGLLGASDAFRFFEDVQDGRFEVQPLNIAPLAKTTILGEFDLGTNLIKKGDTLRIQAVDKPGFLTGTTVTVVTVFYKGSKVIEFTDNSPFDFGTFTKGQPGVVLGMFGLISLKKGVAWDNWTGGDVV